MFGWFSQARGASVLTYRLCKLQPAGVTVPSLLPSLPPRRANAPCKMDGYLSLRDRVQRAVQPNLGRTRTELSERGRGQQSRHFSGANNFIAAWRGQGAAPLRRYSFLSQSQRHRDGLIFTRKKPPKVPHRFNLEKLGLALDGLLTPYLIWQNGVTSLAKPSQTDWGAVNLPKPHSRPTDSGSIQSG